MKNSRRMQLGAMLTAMLLLSMAFAATINTVSAAPTSELNKKLSELPKDEQKLILKAIDSSNLLTDTEKKDLTKNLNDIWSGKSTLNSSEQEELLLKAISIYMNYFKIDQPSEVEIQWTDHSRITYLSALSVGVGDYYATIMKYNASAPDSFDWPYVFPRHYYGTGLGGTADYWAKKYTDDAKIYFLMHDYNRAYQNLAYASHYLEDVGNPYHTVSPTSHPINHPKYEDLVTSNWQLWDLSTPIINAAPITVTDPAQAVKDLASYSSAKLNALNTAVENNDYTTIKTLTIDLLSKTASYEKGLINYGKS